MNAPADGILASILVDETDERIVYLGADGTGLFKSIDGGDTWTLQSTGLGSLCVTAIVASPLDPSALYVGLFTNCSE